MRTPQKPMAVTPVALCIAVFVTISPPIKSNGGPPTTAHTQVIGETRTYDVNDMLWWSDDGADETRKVRSDSFVKFITATIEPGTWEGPKAINAIEERDGRLIVRTQTGTHAVLSNILEQLRESTCLQGVSVDCHFMLVDEAFVKVRAPAMLGRKERGAVARGIGPFAARTLVDAARVTPGVVVIPAPPSPLYSLPSTLLIGEERRIKLPRLGVATGAAVNVLRPVGLSLSVTGVAGARYITLDLMVRSGIIDRVGDGVRGGYDEIEGLYHDTFVVERSGAFIICAPLVHATLAGVRDVDGTGDEVMREIHPMQPNVRRYLLVTGTVRSMPTVEMTLLAGARVAKLLDERFAGPVDVPAVQPPHLAPPGRGVPPRGPAVPLPPPQGGPPGVTTRVFDLRGLLLGSERGTRRASARAKRLEHILARLKSVFGNDQAAFQIEHDQMIVTGTPSQYATIRGVLESLTGERLLERD